MGNFLTKLTSRKFIACVVGVIIGIAIAFGVDISTVNTVTGAVVSVASVMSYIIMEGKIDANRVAQTIEVVQDAVETINEEGE